MDASSSLSVGKVLAEFRRLNEIPQDEAERAFWKCQLGPFSVHLPNFRWRKRAILAHDLHHLLTAYPCTLRGECQMAAWEFGAGRMPHLAARWFCLPLVLLGFAWSPRRIWTAYISGKQSRSLHSVELDQRILSAPFESLRTVVARPMRQVGSPSAYVQFAMLIAEAMLIVLVPAIAIALLWLAFGIYPLS